MTSDALRAWAAAHAQTVGPGRVDGPPDRPAPDWRPRPLTPAQVTVRTVDGWPEYAGGVRSVGWAVLPDGRLLLATGSEGGSVRVRDGHTGAVLRTLTGYTYWVASVGWAVLPGGRLLLAAGGGDGSVRVWDGHTGAVLRTLTGRTGEVVSSVGWAVLPDGRLLLAAGGGDGSVRVWDGHTGAVLRTLTGRSDWVWSLGWAVLPDGRPLLATGSSSRPVRVWDGHTGAVLHTLTGHRDWVLSVGWAVLPDGRALLATGSEDETVRVWDGHTGAALRTLTGHRGRVLSVGWAVLPDGRLLLATGSHDRSVRVWDGHTGAALHALTGLTGDVESVGWAVLPDGRLLLAANTSQTSGIGVWQVDLEPSPDTPARPTPTPTGTQATDPAPVLLDRTEEITPAAWSHPLRRHPSTTALAWAVLPGGRLLLATASDDGSVRVWDGHTRTTLHTLTDYTDWAWSVAWAVLPDGRLLLATGSNDRNVRVWDGHTRTALHTLTGHTGTVWSVAWAVLPDGRLLLATGSDDGSVRVWDGHTGTTLHTLTGHTNWVQSVAWAVLPDGRLLLATGSDDRSVRVWDGHTGTTLHTLTGHTSPVLSVASAVLPDGQLLLAIGARQSVVRIWRLHLVPAPGQQPAVAGRGAFRAPTLAEGGLVAFGVAGLWPPLGLVADLVTLTGPTAGQQPVLNDGRLLALVGHPGIQRLRDLGWPAPARLAFGALLASRLTPRPAYVAPDGVPPAALGKALALARAAGLPARPADVDLGELRAAADAITDRTMALLAVLGPATAAADPMLPLRLAHHAAQLPAFDSRQLRMLTDTSRAGAPSGRRSRGPGLWHAPGTVGVERRGTLAQLLPTQLALPPDLLMARYLQNHLLYRRHISLAPPTPEPVTVILDTTPPTYGPVERVLRMVAHLITMTLWEHGEAPVLVSLTQPEAAVPLATRAQLAHLWTTRTLDPPGPALAVAMDTASTTGRPVVLLAHHHAPWQRYLAGPGRRLLTAHHPPEPPPSAPTHPGHHHLPANPSQAQLDHVVRMLVTPTDGAGR